MPRILISPKEPEGCLTVCIPSFLNCNQKNRFPGAGGGQAPACGGVLGGLRVPGVGVGALWGTEGQGHSGAAPGLPDARPDKQWAEPVPQGGPPPGLSQSPPPPSRADTAARSPRGRGGRGLARGPPADTGCPRRVPVTGLQGQGSSQGLRRVRSPSRAAAALPRGSLPAVGVQTGRGAPWVPENPGDQRQARASCAGDAQAPQGRSTAAPGTLQLRHPTLKPPSPALSPQGGGDPCVLQAAQGLHRKAFAFGWLFPRNWGVSCAGLVLSWLRPDGTRALPAGPARVHVAFGAWGGLRPLEPAQKDQSAPFPNHLSLRSLRARLPNSLSCKYPSPRPSGRQT